MAAEQCQSARPRKKRAHSSPMFAVRITERYVFPYLAVCRNRGWVVSSA